MALHGGQGGRSAGRSFSCVMPNSVRMIVSATTDDGLAVAFDKVTLVAWRPSVRGCIVTERGPSQRR
jgi:hypothetical protein